jgi:hypothetical protein
MSERVSCSIWWLMEYCGEKGRLTLQTVARILCEGIVCKSTGLIMCGVVPPLFHIPSWCTQGQLNVTFIVLYKHRYGTYWHVIFMTFFRFIHWELEICFFPLHHQILSFKKYCLFPYSMTLFDTVLYCLTYRVLSCLNLVFIVIETDGQ